MFFRKRKNPEEKTKNPYANDKKWEQLAKQSEELGIESWNADVVCLKTIHPHLIMGSRWSAQNVLDGKSVLDQYNTEYRDSKTLKTLCIANKETCAYCTSSKRYAFHFLEDRHFGSDTKYLSHVCQAAKHLHSELLTGNTVLVHCHSGRNRSALVILVYCCMFTNLSYEDALFMIRKYNSRRFSMQSTLKNSSFTSHVRINWNSIRNIRY